MFAAALQGFLESDHFFHGGIMLIFRESLRIDGLQRPADEIIAISKILAHNRLDPTNAAYPSDSPIGMSHLTLELHRLFDLSFLIKLVQFLVQFRYDIHKGGNGSCAAGEKTLQQQVGATGEHREFGGGEFGRKTVELSKIPTGDFRSNDVGMLGEGSKDVGIEIYARCDNREVIDQGRYR